MPFFTSLFAAPRGAAFPRLSENLATSDSFEIRRQIRGPVRAMFALPQRREVIVAADGYLWRFSADGRLLDTLDAPGDMHRNGIAFGDDGFVDWVHTGKRTRQAYGPEVDGNAFTTAQLHAALSAARAVAFGKRDERAWAWLWTGDAAWKMDITRHRAQVDTSCTLRSSTDETVAWSDTCLDGFESPAPLMVEVRPGAFDGGGAGIPSRVDVVAFDRRHYHLEGGVAGYVSETVVGGAIKAVAPHLPGALPRRYWFGDASVRLRVDDEALQFKVFVGRDADDYEFEHMVDWWDPSIVIPGASPWLRVRMRGYMNHPGEDALWTLYGPDFGLYAVRPRTPVQASAPSAHPVPAWRPAFEGPMTPRDAVTGIVVLDTGDRVHRWWRAKPAGPRIVGPTVALDADSPALHALPVSLQVEWGSPWSRDTHAVLEVELDPAATRSAFAALPRADGPATLLLEVPDLFGEVDDMRLSLRRGGSVVPLDRVRLAYSRRPPFRPWRPRDGQPAPPTRIEQLQRTADVVPAGGAEVLARFRAQAEALAHAPDMVARATPFITAAYARLLGELNAGGRADASVTLARHYLAEVHPHTSKHATDPATAYNTSVIASQTLAVAVHRPQDAALVDTVLARLVGSRFDPDTHTNATLLYNLACYYALTDDRSRMLRHVAAAARLGKPAAQFLGDRDFERYWDDPAFTAATRGERGRPSD
ncbi:TPR end-of-group domain-containing protein [Luteimonas deserti]|uniref:Uncharacterized protein n=1 Tax=Luteimonas deserti TaxID=2752306 RepID=A0A7Z0QQX6_9GAMM|nr:hypothetical protein [Luteimonas deserti]NYZ63207.1 hypothetical protein [Luteimonas deserti]